MIPRASFIFSCLIVLLSSLWTPARAQQTGPAEVFRQNGRTYLRIGGGELPPDRLIVKVHPGRSAAFLHATPGARRLGSDPDLFLVPAPPGLEVREAARRYAKRPDVLYAEPDATASLAVTPNDARWSEQWNMVKIGAPTAWDTQTDSSDVVVAVLDTGINFSHPDLQANLWTDPATGAHGFTCLNGTVTPGGLDDQGHGTHVAGVIGAAGNDGLGVAGVNWAVQLLSLKAFNASGGALISDIVLCLDKLVELRQSGVNIRVSNHSWSTGIFSQALQDAMASAESAGVLHVCAAGNSTVDLDFKPEYPAALDGRGILTVAATDASDVPASFTNFGHATVDLAAPGVNILSTVPTGTCASCDPSGYQLLSGTSMATPHVSGVAAALFHLNPALTPAEARDILLQPASTDPVSLSSALGKSTTRARLSFAKAITHPWLTAPQLNGFPQLSVPAQLTRAAGSSLTLVATASDSDGDPLLYQWGKDLQSGLFGNMLNQVLPPGWFFPAVVSKNPYAFTAPSFAIPITQNYRAMINDGRGGSAVAQTWVNIQANPAPGQAPSGTLTVTPTSGPPGTVVTVSYSGSDPEGGSILWGYQSGAGSTCCYRTTQTFNVTLTSAGVYRFNAQSIDPELNVSAVSSVVVRIGDAVGEAPVASLVTDVISGPAPLTVSYDATGSYDPDGGNLTFFPLCVQGEGTVVIPAGPPTGTCTFDEPGPHTIEIAVLDSNSYWGMRTVNVMALGSFAPDTEPPAVQITSPASGASLMDTVTLTATASDNEAVSRVELYRDSGVLLGTDTTAPYSVTWNTLTTTFGSHTLYAKVYDESGNPGISTNVDVTVADAPPTVSLVGPADGSTFNSSSTVSISATASDSVGVVRVEFYRDSGVLLGTDSTAPYFLGWSLATAPPGPHTLYAKAYDGSGNATASASVSITVIDVLSPSVGITSPTHGSTVPNNAPVTISASASDPGGIARVDFYRDSGVLLGTDTTAPFSVDWSPATTTTGVHNLYAKAYDQAGNSGTSQTIGVIVTDATPPAVSVTSPADGSTLPNNAPATISASASDEGTVSRVEFYRDSGVLLGSDTTAPYSLSWSLAGVTLGSHAIYAKAFDGASNTTTSTAVSVTVTDATPPAVSITSPANGGTVTKNTTITISASASDDAGVTRVEFFVGSTLTCTDTTSPYTCSWRVPKTAGASYSLQAKAYDANNNVGTSSVVTVTAR